MTTSLQTWAQVDPFLKRPFFLLVATDGPLRSRYERERRKTPELNLDAFIDAHDALLYTPGPRTPGEKTDVARVLAAAHVAVNNHFGTVEELYNHLDQLDLLDDERLRPGWDLYFMVG